MNTQATRLRTSPFPSPRPSPQGRGGPDGRSPTLTRLQMGMVIDLGGIRYRIEMVNDCRALCRPVEKKTEVYTPLVGKDPGTTIVIQKRREPISISPNSECEIIEWGATTDSTDGKRRAA